MGDGDDVTRSPDARVKEDMQLKLERIETVVPHQGPRLPVPSTLDRATPALPVVGRVLYHVALWLMVAAVLPLLWGWRATVVTSGSMSPSIDTGDIVVTAPHDGIGLGPGVIAVFSDGNGGQVAHRIVAVNGGGTYVTRGDANDNTDSSPLHPQQVVGVGRMLIPFVGLPLVWIDQRIWEPFLWGVAVVVAGLVWRHLVRLRPAKIEDSEW